MYHIAQEVVQVAKRVISLANSNPSALIPFIQSCVDKRNKSDVVRSPIYLITKVLSALS